MVFRILNSCVVVYREWVTEIQQTIEKVIAPLKL